MTRIYLRAAWEFGSEVFPYELVSYALTASFWDMVIATIYDRVGLDFHYSVLVAEAQ